MGAHATRRQLFKAAGLTLALLAAAEVLVRVHQRATHTFLRAVQQASDGDPRFWNQQFEAYPYVMHRTRPNQQFGTIHINALGFRGPEVAIKKPPGRVRIVLLGGSVVWGTGASSDAQTISAHLERRLNAGGSGRRFEVINAGDSGYVTAQEFITFWDRVLVLQPDWVITLDGYNDLYAGLTNRTAGYPQEFSALKEKLELRGGVDYGLAMLRRLLQRSALLRMLADTPRRVALRRTMDAEGVPALYADPGEVSCMYERNLRSVDVLARDAGVRTLFALQPMLGIGTKQITEEEAAVLRDLNERVPGYTSYLRRTSDALSYALGHLRRERQARILNLMDAFNDIRDRVFLDGCHFADAANQRIAMRLEAALRPALSVGTTPPEHP